MTETSNRYCRKNRQKEDFDINESKRTSKAKNKSEGKKERESERRWRTETVFQEKNHGQCESERNRNSGRDFLREEREEAGEKEKKGG